MSTKLLKRNSILILWDNFLYHSLNFFIGVIIPEPPKTLLHIRDRDTPSAIKIKSLEDHLQILLHVEVLLVHCPGYKLQKGDVLSMLLEADSLHKLPDLGV